MQSYSQGLYIVSYHKKVAMAVLSNLAGGGSIATVVKFSNKK